MCLHHSLVFLLLMSLGLGSLSAQIGIVDSLKKEVETQSDDSLRMGTLIVLAEKLQYSDPDACVSYAQQALQIAEARNDSLAIAEALSRMGSGFALMSRLDEAMEIRRRIISIYQKVGTSRDLGMQCLNLATSFDSKGMLDSAIYYYEKALTLFGDGGTALDSAILYNNYGIVYERLGNYSRCAEIYLKALAGFEKAGREDYMSFAYANLGNVYVRMGEKEKAKSTYLAALDIKITYNDRRGEAVIYNNLSAIYNSADELDSAILLAEKSAIIREEIRDNGGLIDIYNQLGEVHGKKGAYEKGIGYLKKAYDIASASDSKALKAKSAIGLGKLFNELRRDRESINYLKEGFALSQKASEREIIREANMALATYYRQRQDPRGYAYYERAVQLDDSLRNDEETRKITRLEMQYEFDKEREFLELERKTQELAFSAELDRQRFQRNIGLGALGSGLIILLILWRSYRIQKSNRTLLQKQNEKLGIALRDRENLLKEIHHRVKNNLQVVSSLLSLQSRSIKDPAALDAIEEGRNRVKAMGLIHQNLYQEENLVGVNLPQYIEKLTDNLLESYKIQHADIHINRKVEKLSIDVDTLIPLGLILNELISNSLKYAFEGRKEGKIDLYIGKSEEGLKVEIADDGVGLPGDFNFHESKSMGYKLIRAFVKKMKAKFEIVSEQGTRVKILLPDTKAQFQLS